MHSKDFLCGWPPIVILKHQEGRFLSDLRYKQ